jgi:hypothetical protein
VLATCGIRPPDKALEKTQSSLLLLADSERGRVPSNAFTRSSLQMGNVRCAWDSQPSSSGYLQSLHHRARRLDKPNPPLSWLWTLTDLPRASLNSWQKTHFSESLSLSSCTGYLDHPFKKCPVRRRKIFIPCLQTQEGWFTIRSRHQHLHARTTLFS